METQNQSNPQSVLAESTPGQAEPQPMQAKDSRRQQSQEPKPRTRRTNRVSAGRKRQFSVRELKTRIQARLGSLGNTRLKQVLIVCGIAASLAVAIIAFTKFVPVGVAILAILGLGVVVRFMQELRRLPFYPSL